MFAHLKSSLIYLLVIAVLVIDVGISPFGIKQVQAEASACYEIWNTPIRVQDANGNSLSLTLGQGLQAVNGLDACDISAPPPPPTGAFDAWLSDGSISYKSDFRLADRPGTITWVIFYQPSTNGNPITLSWDAAALPKAGTWYLRDGFGGFFVNLDMSTQNSLVVPNPALTQLNIIYTTTRCTVTAIGSGNWNSSGTWNSNCSGIPAATDDVYIPSGFSINFDLVAATVESLTLGNGGALVFQANSSLTLTENGFNRNGLITLGALGMLAVNGSMTNDGRIQKTIDIDSTCTVIDPCRFPGIWNASKTTLKYAGIDVVPTGGDLHMGVTSVTVYGGQTCGTSGNKSTGVKRCFNISPAVPLAATITFYYLPNEENGNALPVVWNLHGGNWSQETVDQRGSANGALFVGATGISLYSTFALMQEMPTAVSIALFAAKRSGNSIRIDWETIDEVDLLGFNIWRSASLDGEKEKINQDMIVTNNPGQMIGSTYRYTYFDQGTGYYWLEIVKLNGSVFHGPISAISYHTVWRYVKSCVNW